MTTFLGSDASVLRTEIAKRVKVHTLSTERAVSADGRDDHNPFDFVARGTVKVTRLADSSCKVLHQGRVFYSIKVSGKRAVHVRAGSPLIVNGEVFTVNDFYNSILAP
jgi:hypothetical protein